MAKHVGRARRGGQLARAFALVAPLAAGLACAAPMAQGRPSTASELSGLRAIHARGPGEKVLALTSELRLRYNDSGGRRFRGTLLMWLQRPDRLRLHVLGPQGSPIAYVVMGDGEVAMMDTGAATVRRGPATAAVLDRLLPLAPVGLDAQGWVRLLLGEYAWPDVASGQATDSLQELSWQEGDRSMQMQLELPDALLRRLACEELGRGRWSAEVLSRDPAGLPAALQLEWAGAEAELAGAVSGNSELRLRDVERNPDLPPGLFSLKTPAGFVEHSP